MAEILVAEDERDVRDGLQVLLESEGYAVRTAADGAAALEAIRARRPDLLLLDVMMPKLTGYEVLMSVRRTDPALPVLVLTAKVAEADKVLGLGLGADDYVTKPFGRKTRELLARVAAAIRRGELVRSSAPSPSASGSVAAPVSYAVRSHRFDWSRQVLVDAKGNVRKLTKLEAGVLRLLVEHPGRIVTRDAFADALWGAGRSVGPHAIESHVFNLRRKLGADGACIEPVYATGYRFDP